MNAHGMFLGRRCRIHQYAAHLLLTTQEDALVRALAYRAHLQLETTVGYRCGCAPVEDTPRPTTHNFDCPACASTSAQLEGKLLRDALGVRGPGNGDCEICERKNVRLVRHHAHLGPRPESNPISLDGLHPPCNTCNRAGGALKDDFEEGGLMHGLEEYGEVLANSIMEYFDSSTTL